MVKFLDVHKYHLFLKDIITTIHERQLVAFREANKQILELYRYIGNKIAEKQRSLGWGKSVVKKLREDLQREFPDIQGFSQRNLWNMRNFYLAYEKEPNLQLLSAEIGWTHNLVILERVKDPLAREFYMISTKKYGWTSRVLIHKVENGDFERFVLSDSHNFDKTLPDSVKNQAKLALKDHYLFSFLELGEEHKEKELEDALIEYKIRSGIEATNSELKNKHGAGKLKVRDYARIELAMTFKSLALNINCFPGHKCPGFNILPHPRQRLFTQASKLNSRVISVRLLNH